MGSGIRKSGLRGPRALDETAGAAPEDQGPADDGEPEVPLAPPEASPTRHALDHLPEGGLRPETLAVVCGARDGRFEQPRSRQADPRPGLARPPGRFQPALRQRSSP